MTLPEDYGFVPGRSRTTAIKLLAAADAAGIDQTTIRTVADGYQVPDAVLAEFNKHLDAEDAAIDSEPPATEPAPAKHTALAADNLAEPAKNASTEDWLAYAHTRVNWDEADAQLGRNELAAKYATPEPQA